VKGNNLYLERLEDHAIRTLTEDGGPTLINGTFDWVYEEELGLRDGFRFSPDGRLIAYWQFDTTGVRDYYMLNTTDDIYSRVIPVQYPKAGETNSACRVGVVSVEGGATRWFDIEGDPRNHYLARMDWAESDTEVVIQQLNRLQNTNRVLLADAATGAVRCVLTEKDEAWVDVGDDLTWIEDGQAFLWVSERDGWRHVYRVPRDGGDPKLLTPGDFDVIEVVHVDERRGLLYYIASPENPGQRYLYHVSLDGSGRADRVTPPDYAGTNSYRVSPDGRWAFHTHSAFGVPPTVSLVRLPGHETVRLLEGNEKARENMQGLASGKVEFFRVKTQAGVAMDGYCMKPSTFDPSRRYPLLIYVYGEPAGQTVLDRWGREVYLWHRMLTEQGYVVISMDNRGTPAPRGRTWRKCIYRKVGITAPKDQADALRVLLKRWSWIDPDRIGIWGWSGGGSMTLNAVFKYPGLYHTGMSVAPVANQRYYDTLYQERYMGLPQDNPEGYKEGSPVHFARQLEGNLLIVHGTADDNCHYQSLEAVANELIRANKHFTMMAYPNRGHSIYQGTNTRRHLFGLLTRYLKENLAPGPRD
jgi:dipeptidyl-peptidase-4